MINVWYHSKTASLKLCAHASRSLACASIFNTVYDTPHKISFRMSGRSFLYDLWFSQTLRHKNYIYILMFGVYENFSALIIIRMRRKIFVFLIFANSLTMETPKVVVYIPPNSLKMKNKRTFFSRLRGRSENILYYLSFQIFRVCFFGSYGFKLKITQKNERLMLPIFKIDYK